MDLSKQKQNEAKKLGVTVQYLIMADLMAIGYGEEDAYAVAYPENEALAQQQSNSIRQTIVDSAKFKKLLDKRIERVKEGIATPVSPDEVELIGTEEVLREMLSSARQQPKGSKERADLYAKYYDIKKESEQGTEDDTDAISFYFPAKCNQCPLLYAYNEEMKKCMDENGKIIRPVEMGRVIKLSHKIIQAAMDAEE